MDYIDLHVHSCCSDGTFTPEELVRHGIELNLKTIAVTDHDTVEGVKRAIEEAPKHDGKISVIPGVELSCEYVFPDKTKEIHILGYNIDYENKDLISRLNQVAAERDNRNKIMCQRLHDAGYPITYEELIDKFGDNIITRAHFAKILIANGGVSSIDQAFKTCLSAKSEYYVHRKYLTYKEGIDLIKQAGGKPVLAHPLLYKLSVNELDSMIKELKDYGILGIEAMYSRNHGNDETFVRSFAEKYDLFVTGGSDFHGSNKPDIEMGIGTGHLRVPITVLENL